DDLAAEAAAGAALVLDDDALAEDCAEPVRDDAHQAVGQSARRERHDDLDRPVGVGVGLGLRDADAVQGPAGAQQCRNQGSRHPGYLPYWSGDADLYLVIGASTDPEIGA